MREEKQRKTRCITEEVTVYISEDGETFHSKEACLEHEADMKKLNEIEQCASLEGCPNFNGGENMESHEYIWFRPKDRKELELIRSVYPTDLTIDENLIGKWVCVEYSCESDYAWYSTLDNAIEYAKDILNKLGYSMTVTPNK